MLKFASFFFLLFALLSCRKEQTTNCIVDQVEAFKLQPDAQFIRKIPVDDGFHYWFNVYASPVDHQKISWILTENCDTVCHACTGWCIHPACFSSYDQGDWQTVWEK